MNDVVALFKEFTPGAWGIWTGVVIFTGYMLNQWRLDRKLSADDRLARREGYAAQVAMLMAENRALLADQAALRKEYDDHRKICQAETDQLRKMVIQLEAELEGLKRQRADDVIRDIRGGAGAHRI